MTEFAVDDYQCFVSFRGPGYSADAFIDRATGEYELTEARLGVVALLISVGMGVPLGIVAALKQNTVWDYLGMGVAIFGVSVPNIVLGPLLILAAMDVPVVASDLGGVGEIVVDGETGYKVESGDIQGLAEAIARLWENQEAYAHMRAKVRQLMVENFDKEKQFDVFLEFFRKVVA